MLSNWTIRKKLIAGLTCLTVIFGVLSTSVFFGLHRYHSLANEVEQRAIEIKFAHNLNRDAETLRHSEGRLRRLESQQVRGFKDHGMIEESMQLFLDNQIEDEKSTIDMSMLQMSVAIESYEQHLSSLRTSDEKSLLVDRDLQWRSLNRIKATFAKIQESGNRPSLLDDRALDGKLSELVDATHEHFELIQEGITAFRKDVHDQYNGWMWTWGLCTTGAFFMVLVLGWSFRTLVVKPFQTLLAGSRLVAGGQFGHRIDLGTRDELSELAEAMNAMSARFLDAYESERTLNRELERKVRDRTRELIKNEQLASVGFLAAGVAHEINNPLAAIAFSAEELGENVEDLSELGATPIEQEIYGRLQKNLKRIHDQAFRCKGITDRLLDFSRLGDSTRSANDLAPLVEELVSMVGKVGKYQCKSVRVHSDEDVSAICNKQEITQVVLNLVTNALESVDTDGSVDVYVKWIGESAAVVVEDNGCGMDAEVREHLFEPFYTRRKDGTGTGLGLSISYRIVSQHCGSLLAESEGVGLGSRLTLLLPAAVKDSSQDQTLQWNHEPQKVA